MNIYSYNKFFLSLLHAMLIQEIQECQDTLELARDALLLSRRGKARTICITAACLASIQIRYMPSSLMAYGIVAAEQKAAYTNYEIYLPIL